MAAQAQLVKEVLAAMSVSGTRILNVGAGHNPWVEYGLHQHRRDFVCDRIDLEPPTVLDEHQEFAHVGECWTGSVEWMPQVPDSAYGVAFANYVLEHVGDLDATARELRRVLRPNGSLVLTVPNPAAPQMRLAAHTPLWIHRVVRRTECWPTVYAFGTPDELAAILEQHGFHCREIHRYSNVSEYLVRWPLIGPIGRFYDRIVERLRLRRLLADACIVCEAV